MSSGKGNIQIEFRDTSAGQYDGNGIEIKFNQQRGNGKLYVGDRHCGTYLQLKHRKCRSVLCCSTELFGYCLEEDVKYHKMDPMEDEEEGSDGSKTKSSDALWEKTYNFIDDTLGRNENIILQCGSGAGKSVAVAIYYIMRKTDVSLEKSYKLVESCQREAKIRPWLLMRLIKLEKGLRGTSSMYLENKKPRFGAGPGSSIPSGGGKDDDKLLSTVIKFVIYGGAVLIAYVLYAEIQKAQI